MNCNILVTPRSGETYISNAAVNEYLIAPYKRGESIAVSFEKKNGEIRDMRICRDRALENQAKGLFDTSSNGCLTVCETAANGSQWRKINLSRIFEIRLG